MRNRKDPPELLVIITRMKYKAASVPLALVVISLTLEHFFAFQYSKYVSLFGLLLFLITLQIFRINTANHDDTTESLLSPISGSVSSIEKTDTDIIVTIDKRFFHSSDIRLSAANDYVKLEGIQTSNNKPQKKHHLPAINELSKSNWFVKGHYIFYFSNHSNSKGALIGLLLGPGCCLLTLPASFDLQISQGETLRSGETIIGNNRQ